MSQGNHPMSLPPGLFWTLTNDPFLFFSMWWPEKTETALPGFLRLSSSENDAVECWEGEPAPGLPCVRNPEVTAGRELDGRRITRLR